MKCPLRKIIHEREAECLGKDCAWYDEARKECAILSLVNELRELSDNL